MDDKKILPDSSLSERPPDHAGEADEELAMLAKALAHPARVQILRILAGRTSCVCGDIVNQLPLAQSTVSEHLRILKAAGLIVGEIDGPRVCYCIDVSVLDRFRFLVQGFPRPIDLSNQSKSEVN
jgi:ArsR family transcriptional regulator